MIATMRRSSELDELDELECLRVNALLEKEAEELRRHEQTSKGTGVVSDRPRAALAACGAATPPPDEPCLLKKAKPPLSGPSLLTSRHAGGRVDRSVPPGGYCHSLKRKLRHFESRNKAGVMLEDIGQGRLAKPVGRADGSLCYDEQSDEEGNPVA